MNRHPNWHRRVFRYGLPLTILSVLVSSSTGWWISAVFGMGLAVALTRDFLLHRAQQRRGCVCDWSNMRFVAMDGCPHHGKLWPYRRPPPPQGVALKAVVLVTTTTAMAALLFLGLARIV